MNIRWLHKIWSFFWATLGVLFVVILIVGGILFGVLQLPATKNYIVNNIEERFNNQFNGVLKLGEFTGSLPLEFSFSKVDLYPDSTTYDPIFSTDTVSATIDLWALFSNRIVINGLSVSSPKIILDSSSDKSINTVISKKSKGKEDSISENAPFLEIFAPSVQVKNGTVLVKNIKENGLQTLDSITIQNIELQMFLDYNKEARFLDIDQFSANIPELDIPNINFFGQIFNDERFLEFNAFNIRVGNSLLKFSGQADGVNLFEQDILAQVRESKLNIEVDELIIDSNTAKRFYSDYPIEEDVLFLSMESNGNFDSLWVNKFQIGLGESSVDGYGYLVQPFEPNQIEYWSKIRNVLIDSSEINYFPYSFNQKQIDVLISASFEGEVKGNTENIDALLEMIHTRGSINLIADAQLDNDLPIKAKLTFSSFDIGEIITPNIISSNFTGEIELESSSLKDFKKAIGNAFLRLEEGSINGVQYNSFSSNATWQEGIINPSFELISPTTEFSGMGTINVKDSIPEMEFSGVGRNLNIKDLAQVQRMNAAIIDVEYEVFLKGTNVDNVFGQLSVIVPTAIVDGDTLPSHQLYADFNDPTVGERQLRVTSTAVDFSLEGDFKPKDLAKLIPHWSTYFKERVKQEIFLKNTSTSAIEAIEVENQDIRVSILLKELGLVEKYFPSVPSINSSARLNANINMDSDRILFNGDLFDQKFVLRGLENDSLSVQFTGSFRRGDKLKTFSGLQIETSIKTLNTEYISGKGFDLSFDLDDDSIMVEQSLEQIADGTSLELLSEIALSDSAITAVIRNFELGSELYKWQNQNLPEISYLPKNKIAFRDFIFTNINELISLEGTFSNIPSDSVNYLIRDVDLYRISQLINGRINFAGKLDGQFTTRSLTRIPTIQGELNIIEFGIDNNTVGDLRINSSFNQSLNRFDTNISISTDSTKYPEYFIRNDRQGQDISLNGYVLAPENGEFPKVDSLFSFDLDFSNVDLWVIPFIAPKVFSEMSGKASGNGIVWGNLENYDFNIDYEVGMDDAVYMKPKFLDTYYYGQGLVNFSRSNGLRFDDLFIIDPSGGSAILSGTYNLNDFQQIHYIDLELEMEEFQFLNSTFDPNIAFFGEAYGSSTIQMTGTNLNPVLSTLTPIYISDFSNIGIPLLEETEFDEDNKFIRFVNDFSFSNEKQTSSDGSNTNFTIDIENDPFDRTFIERFTIDLQFIATQPMTVQLIFDPITGDIITAEGTGRVRIRLQDEELTMFGQFDISGGNYNFVSGDIFTRRFDLERGGTIIWDGLATDARLNLNAVYEARPDINTLTRARSDIDQETSQRVPVQLVLNIGGSLSSIENNFFFRLPNNFEVRQNTTLSTQINTLNRNEDEKLIQATSFLLMGDFIPSTSASTDGTNSLSNNFSGSGAVLNPLISSQVISPLLSNQINSLLRSDVGSLDIDFNLNTYNNVDLAVALRLYNDRIILSREGQITGSQSNIGDLGATYRINETLSVTAFHRQDPTFSGIGGVEESQQAQDINGVGLEAEVSFDNWREFFRKIGRPFRKLFGIKEKAKTEELTQIQNSSSQGMNE